ncbi:PKD domain-containing protein [Hymenobacter cellulosilyticus]|uniref:PKD domain-containing protein n=1 Tax=Hymenobacter cellulosilyticus TaxID=2932248 RepID=A0A8T9Q1A8_9BACT|nr:PKD domain-containing protein [Hymenobacter cellulosilyticus]UOQ71536.1 PKD domain-containing protein [Hymenobacter cellulosilyticus]
MHFTVSRLPLLAAVATLGLSSCKKDDTETVAPKPKAAFAYTASTCQGNCPVTFQNSSQNASSYAWDFGDNTTGTQTEASFGHAYAQAGVYRVKLRATGAGGVDTTSQRITVGVASGCTRQVIPVTSAIGAATTWESCNVYVVDGDISVNNVLTLQPGTVVKFKPGSKLTLNGSGRVEAVGTAAAPIFFTSVKDDAHGGDTNADAGATAPARKDWDHVNLNGKSGSRLEYCQFLYAGGGGTNSYSLGLNGADASIRNSTFAHSGGGGASMRGALSAGEATANVVITSNVFFDNEMPLRVNTLFSLDNSNSFQNPQNASQKNDYNGIWVTDPSARSQQLSWGETEVPFVLDDTNWESHLTLDAGVTLKLLPNALMQFNAGGYLTVQGTAAQPVIFTSYKDDAHGGDTNHDGNASAPAKKDWRNILAGSSAESELSYCQLLYGGSGGSTISLFGAAASITHCTFAHNGQDDGLTEATLDASRAKAGTVIQDNVFFDNVRPLSIASSLDLDNSNSFHNPLNTAEKNQYQGIVTYWDINATKASLSWEETEVAFVNLQNLDLVAGKTLRLGNNVTLKFLPGTEVFLRGAAEQLQNAAGTGVTFTSYKDDSRGGDSNGNGAANSPAAGDWKGVYAGAWKSWSNIYFASN